MGVHARNDGISEPAGNYIRDRDHLLWCSARPGRQVQRLCIRSTPSRLGLLLRCPVPISHQSRAQGRHLREQRHPRQPLKGLNITKASEQQTLLENISRLERHNPAQKGESILYLPLMFAGCGAFVYIMFLKGSDFERTMLRNLRRITKKANASREGGMIDKDDWLKGTAASQGTGARNRSHKK